MGKPADQSSKQSLKLSLKQTSDKPLKKHTSIESSLLKRADLWRASSLESRVEKNESTGFSRLDQQLPNHGWPTDGLTEVLHDAQGIGEFRLLTPALARISHEDARWILLVSPPYVPYPPALLNAGVDISRVIISQPRNLKDYLWVLEKSLASESCNVVIAWPGNSGNGDLNPKQLRRLQVASKNGHCWAVIYRPEKTIDQPSPAELRIRVRAPETTRDNSAALVKVLKRRGGWEGEEVLIEFDDELLRPMPQLNEMQVQQPRQLSSTDPEPDELDQADEPGLSDHIPQTRYEYQ